MQWKYSEKMCISLWTFARFLMPMHQHYTNLYILFNLHVSSLLFFKLKAYCETILLEKRNRNCLLSYFLKLKKNIYIQKLITKKMF